MSSDQAHPSPLSKDQRKIYDVELERIMKESLPLLQAIEESQQLSAEDLEITVGPCGN